MVCKIIVRLVIICQLNIVWCKPWPQYGFNQSLNSAGNVNWQNPHYRDANSYGLDPITTTPKPLYPSLQPKYQPNYPDPWNNNNHSPQLPYGNDGQRSVNPSVYPLQPNLDNIHPNNQETIPPFKYNGPYNINNNHNWTRSQLLPTRPFAAPTFPPYNRSLPTNRPVSGYNNNENRYNGGVYPNSQLDSSRNSNPQYPYQAAGLNAHGNVTGNIYNYRPQNYDNPPGQPYNRNSNVQRAIDPHLGNNNIGQTTYNTPSSNNNYNRQFPNNGQSTYNIGQSSYNGPSNYNNQFNNHNNNNVISNRNNFEPSAQSIDSVKKNNVPPAQPDYDPNGIALAPFPVPTENDPLFNPQNIYGRQRPNKYIDHSIHNTGTLHVPLAPFPNGPQN